MTIQGSQRPAALIALGVVVMLAVLAPSAVLLKQPALLVLLVLIAPVLLLFLLLQIDRSPSPSTALTLSIAPAAGRRERRVPTSRLARWSGGRGFSATRPAPS
jgi:hypothetical protein